VIIISIAFDCAKISIFFQIAFINFDNSKKCCIFALRLVNSLSMNRYFHDSHFCIVTYLAVRRFCIDSSLGGMSAVGYLFTDLPPPPTNLTVRKLGGFLRFFVLSIFCDQFPQPCETGCGFFICTIKKANYINKQNIE